MSSGVVPRGPRFQFLQGERFVTISNALVSRVDDEKENS